MKMDVDPGRAARAAIALADGDMRIASDEEEGGVYAVGSFTSDRTYRVQVGGEGSCTCEDAVYNGAICKHRIALALARGLS